MRSRPCTALYGKNLQKQKTFNLQKTPKKEQAASSSPSKSNQKDLSVESLKKADTILNLNQMQTQMPLERQKSRNFGLNLNFTSTNKARTAANETTITTERSFKVAPQTQRAANRPQTAIQSKGSSTQPTSARSRQFFSKPSSAFTRHTKAIGQMNNLNNTGLMKTAVPFGQRGLTQMLSNRKMTVASHQNLVRSEQKKKQMSKTQRPYSALPQRQESQKTIDEQGDHTQFKIDRFLKQLLHTVKLPGQESKSAQVAIEHIKAIEKVNKRMQ